MNRYRYTHTQIRGFKQKTRQKGPARPLKRTRNPQVARPCRHPAFSVSGGSRQRIYHPAALLYSDAVAPQPATAVGPPCSSKAAGSPPPQQPRSQAIARQHAKVSFCDIQLGSQSVLLPQFPAGQSCRELNWTPKFLLLFLFCKQGDMN